MWLQSLPTHWPLPRHRPSLVCPSCSRTAVWYSGGRPHCSAPRTGPVLPSPPSPETALEKTGHTHTHTHHTHTHRKKSRIGWTLILRTVETLQVHTNSANKTNSDSDDIQTIWGVMFPFDLIVLFQKCLTNPWFCFKHVSSSDYLCVLPCRSSLQQRRPCPRSHSQ